MKIKDVEKLTGLTAKSIRYYESKDLITVERNEENSYREYSQEDVNRLRWIKLFRYLEFSIEEIKQLLTKDAEQIKEALHQKADTFSEQKDMCEDKQSMCLALAKDYKASPEVIEEYNDTIEFLESDELAEMMDKLEDYASPNLVSTIVQSLVCLAPVFWLFYNIKLERMDMLAVNAVLALLGTALTTWNWIHYVNQYRKNKNRVKKKTREMVWMIPVLIVTCIAGLIAFVMVISGVSEILIPDDYLFFEHGPIAGIALIWLIMIPVILVCVLLVSKLRRKSVEEMEEVNDILFIWNHLGKWRPIAIVIWLVALYCCVTSMNAVTPNQIIHYSPLHPTGVAYDYSDVESITTGFGSKNFAIAEYKKKGNFFYQIELDGKSITFSVPSTNEDIERYMEDTYLELEEFDQALMELGIPKTGSDKGYKNCDLDKRYVERFLRIIER